MGKILNTKISKDNKFTIKILLKDTEAQILKNNYKNIHLFSEEICEHPTQILEKGTQKSAKYFFIPNSLKSRKKTRYSKITYQKIETQSKVFFIVVATKNLLAS